MARGTLIGIGTMALMLLMAAPRPLQAGQAGNEQAGSAATQARQLLDTYCVTCHNGRLQTAGLQLDQADVARVGDAAGIWERVVRKVRAHAMPPPGRPRPDAAAARALVAWLETELDRAAMVRPDPGRPPIHRLNRTEYANAIRDLFGLTVDVRGLLPADEEQHGFDNIAEVLSVSPTLIERYLAAAQQISQQVVGDPSRRPAAQTYPIPGALDQNDTISVDLPFGSRGGIAIRHHFPVDGEYIIRLDLRKQEYGYVRGLGQPHRLDVRIDGAGVGTFTVGREWEPGQLPPMGYAGKFDEVYDTSSFPEWEEYSLNAHKGLEVRTPVRAGQHLVGIAFDRRPARYEGFKRLPIDRSSYSHGQDEMQQGNPAVSVVQIIGPYDAGGASGLASRDRLFVCQPTGERRADERCAGEILSALVKRAYRRPATEADVRALLPFFEAGQTDGGFDSGIQAAVERVLVDPEFLFRIETDPPGTPAGEPYRLSSLELASRLSFFLWSSIPDDELLDLGVSGELRDPAVLDAQVRRMLADPRSAALVENFGAQWLQLRKLRNASPDIVTYTAFDENLREAMWRETQLFLEHELRADRPVANLLRADYTFANERLARHYGIPDVYGVQFRQVRYDDDARSGLLGHASILTLTSYANRTSPVVRGVWLLDNFLGTPPSPPPPDVPDLPSSDAENGAALSVRERMERHRESAVCATCHNAIDPLGFALEGFDAIGRRRTTVGGGTPFDRGVPIDASSILTDGTEVHGLTGLRAAILNRPDQFLQTVTEKLLTYALGRSLRPEDMPAVRRISRAAAPDTLTWSNLVTGIVNSPQFLMRRSAS